MAKDSYEWTPEEKAKIESLVNRWKESLTLYWLALIPTYFSLQGYERLMGYIFKFEGEPNFPPYWPIWGEFLLSVVIALALLTWTYSIWLSGAKWKAVIFFLQLIVLQSILAAFVELGVIGIPLNMHLVIVPSFMLFCYGPGLLIGAVKLTKRRAAIIIVTVVVTISCIAFFAIMHRVYWLPLHPDFTWKGKQGPIHSLDQILVILSYIMIFLFVLMVAMTLSEKVRMTILTHEMKERKAKEIKRMKKKI